MSENINFIPANELPVAEGDEVSVLCLEGGELKQKPGASLGGSSVLYIRGTETIDSDMAVGAISFFPAPDGTFEMLKSNLLKGTPVTVVMVLQAKVTTSDGEVEAGAMATPTTYTWMSGDVNPQFPDGVILLAAEPGTFYLLPDDSITTEGETAAEAEAG